jgi:hypothetical protein
VSERQLDPLGVAEHARSDGLPERGERGRFLPRAEGPQRTPERQKLAEAIEHHARAVERLERAREAWSRLRLDEAGAAREKERAEQELAAIRERAPQMMVARLLRGQTEDVVSVEDATAALAAATRAVEDAGQARTLLMEEERAAEQAIEFARPGRNDAVREVLRSAPEIAVLWERFQQARQKVRDLSWMLSAIHVFLGPPFHWDGRLEDRDTGRGDKWKAAITALEADPDAELPGEA